MAGPPTFAVAPRFLGVARADWDAPLVVAGIPLDIGTTNRAGA
ncbi:MAG: agmatinase, partial [Proteobacteria bacterium]|nr:agmatinase [Pseudomonadota bacterium]